MFEFKPVVFRVGSEEYGVDINMVSGIEKVVNIIPIPNSNSNILGIINLRGDVIPVYSLRNKFKMEKAKYTEETKFIIVKADELLLALEVDSVDEIQTIPQDKIYEVPTIVHTKDTEYADKIINMDGRIIVIINVSKLLSDMEVDELKKVIDNN